MREPEKKFNAPLALGASLLISALFLGAMVMLACGCAQPGGEAKLKSTLNGL